MEEFKLIPFLTCESKEMNEYVRNLEEFIVNLEASNIKRMIVSIDNVAAVVADDLDSLIDEGSKHELKVLSDDKESKVFDRFLVLVKMVESFKAVAVTAEGLRPQTAEYIDPTKKRAVKINVDSNAFEDITLRIANRIKEEKNGKK